MTQPPGGISLAISFWLACFDMGPVIPVHVLTSHNFGFCPAAFLRNCVSVLPPSGGTRLTGRLLASRDAFLSHCFPLSGVDGASR